MPLLGGHHGQRHHLVTSMRTKEFLKLYYPYLVHDHQLLFNSKGLDVDGTPPDDLVDCIHPLRLREPEEAPLIIFAKGCRQQSGGIDCRSATDFHQRLVDAERMEDAARFLSVQGVKLSFASYPSGSRASFETQISNKEYIAAMRSHLFTPIHRGLGEEAFCRCRPENAVDLGIYPTTRPTAPSTVESVRFDTHTCARSWLSSSAIPLRTLE